MKTTTFFREKICRRALLPVDFMCLYVYNILHFDYFNLEIMFYSPWISKDFNRLYNLDYLTLKCIFNLFLQHSLRLPDCSNPLGNDNRSMESSNKKFITCTDFNHHLSIDFV